MSYYFFFFFYDSIIIYHKYYLLVSNIHVLALGHIIITMYDK